MILLYDTGARIQELLNLKLKDLHLNNPTPCLDLTGKGNKTRPVPLMDKTLEHLQAYLKVFHPAADPAQEYLLFYTLHHGQPGQMSPDNVARFLKRYGQAAHQVCSEVPLRMHAHLFRHTRGRPFGRLVNASMDATREQTRVFSLWRFRMPRHSGLVSFQRT
jgi:site-specific recombinase XerD